MDGQQRSGQIPRLKSLDRWRDLVAFGRPYIANRPLDACHIYPYNTGARKPLHGGDFEQWLHRLTPNAEQA
jgi:hypothetical protein